MKQLSILALLPALAIGTGTALAAEGDPHAGKARAGVCVSCHGPAGVSGNVDWPNLAGQKPGYLALQLRAFRDGTRQNTLMSPIAQGLSDADIDNLAAYFATLKP